MRRLKSIFSAKGAEICAIIALASLGPSVASAQFFGSPARKVVNATTLPASCSTGDIFIETDASTDANFYTCIDNTWTAQGGGGGGGTTYVAGPTGCITIDTGANPDEIDVDTAVCADYFAPPIATTSVGHFVGTGAITATTTLTAFTNLVPRCWEMNPIIMPLQVKTISLYNTTAGGANDMQIGIFDSANVLRVKTNTVTDLTGSNSAKVFTVGTPVTIQGHGYSLCVVTDDTAILLQASPATVGAALLNSESSPKRVFTVPALGSVDFGTVDVTTLGARSAVSIGVLLSMIFP